MVRKDSSIFGIDLHEQEIRVVQVSTRSNKPFIGKIGRAPMPGGAVVNGHILHPGPIAVALRLLLNSMGVAQTARCVIGVLGDSTTLRTLSVPPVPDNELGTIIAGEVAHYGLIHTPGGAYSYIRLNPPTRIPGADVTGAAAIAKETHLDPDAADDQNPAVVTVMAVEEDVLIALGATVEQANLTIDAMEPTQYAMYRAIMANAGPTPTLFALMVNPSNTDIAFIHKGLIVGYRRIDIGSRVLTLQYAMPGAVVPDFDDRTDSVAVPSELNNLAVHSLSLEVQRTLNFYQREFPASMVDDNIYIAIDDARLEGLAKELTFELGVNIETVQPVTSTDGNESSGEGGGGLSPIYASAFGLAVHGQIMSRVPRLDLFTDQRAGVKKAETQRNFRGSIITSGVAILLGVIGFFLYHRQIAALEQETSDTNAKAAKIRSEIDAVKQKLHVKEMQYKALRNEGVPINEVMDYVANGVKPGTGLQSVAIGADLTVTIIGQSVSETLMIITNQALQACPVITDLRIINFHQLMPQEGTGVGFQLTGKTVSINRVKLPDSTGAVAVPPPASPLKLPEKKIP